MKLVLVGAGGHCLACLDVIGAAGLVATGVLDPRPVTGVAGVPRLGDDAWIVSAEAHDAEFLITVGQIGSAAQRQALHELLRAAGRRLVTVCSPHAIVARDVRLGAGTIVMHRALVNAGATVGANCIINSGALVEHGAMVEDHCHVATGAIVNGGARIGAGVLVGSGAVVLQDIQVAAGALIGAGAVVTRDIDSPGTWVGCPARRLA